MFQNWFTSIKLNNWFRVEKENLINRFVETESNRFEKKNKLYLNLLSQIQYFIPQKILS